ncbi:MAG TPA: hypothetical protein VH442_09040, partial [Micromonosporaceae bacterium]
NVAILGLKTGTYQCLLGGPATTRSATRLMRSAVATDEPPYFCTTTATGGPPDVEKRRQHCRAKTVNQRTGALVLLGASFPRSGGRVPDNGEVPSNAGLPRRVAAVTVVTVALILAGCTGHRPVINQPSPSAAVPTSPIDPAGQLAGLAAAAHDRRYVAVYTISGSGNRTLLAALATDGTWQVDVDGGALSGGANVAILGLKTGTYQCLLGGPATTAADRGTAPTMPPTTPPTPSPSASASTNASASASPGASSSSPPPAHFTAPACVKVAAAGKPVPARYDPGFEHIFTDWLSVLLDRNAAISVFTASPLPKTTGQCYSVEPSTVSVTPAMGSGIFCFAPDGTLTAAKISQGTLTISGPAVAAPPTTALPAPVTTGPPAPIKAPATP